MVLGGRFSGTGDAGSAVGHDPVDRVARMGAGLPACGRRAGLQVHWCRSVHARHSPPGCDGRGGRGGCQECVGTTPVLFPALAGGYRAQRRPQVLGPMGDLCSAGRSCPGVFGCQVGDQRGNFRGHRRRQWRQRLLLVCQCDRQGRPAERKLAGKALERHDAQRVEVGRGHGGRARAPFRRQVRWRPDQRPRDGECRGSRHVGNPEISDLQQPAAADKQVARLDVAVYQASRVRRLQGCGSLSDQVHRPPRIYRPPIQQPGQRRAVDQFHHEVGGIRRVGLAVVVYLRDPRMRQRASMPGLGAEPRQVVLMFVISGTQQLHRYRPLQHEVRGTPHLAHTARGDTAVQSVPVPEQEPGRYLNSGHCHHSGRHYPITTN